MSEDSTRRQIFIASFLTLIAAGIGFAVRGATLGEWANQFGFTNTELGTITGGGLIGFGVIILAGSVIAEKFNYKAVFVLAFMLHVLSAVVTVAAAPIFAEYGKDSTWWCLYIGLFLFAIANGLCEAVINPLVATLYPKQKTHYLNILHAGWPGGLILGTLIAIGFVGKNSYFPLRWEIPLVLFLLPTLWYGAIIIKNKIPKSEAGAAGVSFGEMLKEFAAPVLLLLLFLHACIGYVELGTDSWISRIGDSFRSGIGPKLLMYTSAIMFVLRFFAGPIVEKTNPVGLLCVSSVLGVIGLYTFGSVEAIAMIWVAATIYAFGKTFLWPTMLGIVGERFPRGGALTMGAVGGVGMLSAGFLGGPGIGYQQDLFASRQLVEASLDTYVRYANKDENSFLFFPKVKGLDGQKVAVLLDNNSEGDWAPGTTLESDLETLSSQGELPDSIQSLESWWESAETFKDEDHEPVQNASIYGGKMALKWTAAVPAVMFVGFLILVLYFAATGGYRAVEIDGNDAGT